MEASAVPREAPAGVAGLMPPQVLRLASDAHLVTLIREGRDVAFEIAYSRHHRGILSFCRKLLDDPTEAEDAAQQTFLAAYSDLISSDKPIHLRPWLFTIARNRCYSILRIRREQPMPDCCEAPGESLASQVQRRHDLWDLVRDMRRLPADQRAALVLAEVDSLSHAQIADVLRVSREKVKALVFQARESLQASRSARETECSVIRAELTTGRGAALRRTTLRRHLRDCAGCREYRRQMERHRGRLAAFGPLPAIAVKQAGLVLAGIGTAGTLVAATQLHLVPGEAPSTATRHSPVAPSHVPSRAVVPDARTPRRSEVAGRAGERSWSATAAHAGGVPHAPSSRILVIRRPTPAWGAGGSGRAAWRSRSSGGTVVLHHRTRVIAPVPLRELHLPGAIQHTVRSVVRMRTAPLHPALSRRR